jgi:hypothetical protein
LVVHGFLRAQDGSFTVFDFPGGSTFSVVAMNSGGTVVGVNSAGDGFLRNPDGSLTIFDAPGIGICDPIGNCNMGTGVTDINTSGAIVGTDYATVGPESFLRTPTGTFNVFVPPGTSKAGSGATSINDGGAIVGNDTDANSITHGYLRNPDGTLISIDDPNAVQGSGTFLTRVNARGAIVGYYSDAQRAIHGFVRE